MVNAAVSSVSSKGPFQLQYFGIEGKAEKVRLTFLLAGIDFDDCAIPRDQWAEMKKTTKFGQLPILKIGETEMAQSVPMMKYVAMASETNKTLYPLAEPHKMIQIDEMMALLDDLSIAWAPCNYIGRRPERYGHSKDMDTETKDALVKAMREKFLAEDMPKFMGFLTKALDGNDFLCGSEPTLADCQFIPMLKPFKKGMDYVPATTLDAYPEILAYMDRFLAIPAVKAWYDAKA